MKCSYCNKEFKAVRKSAKYCSTKCRVYFNRKKETEEFKMPKTWIDKYGK